MSKNLPELKAWVLTEEVGFSLPNVELVEKTKMKTLRILTKTKSCEVLSIYIGFSILHDINHANAKTDLKKAVFEIVPSFTSFEDYEQKQKLSNMLYDYFSRSSLHGGTVSFITIETGGNVMKHTPPDFEYDVPWIETYYESKGRYIRD